MLSEAGRGPLRLGEAAAGRAVALAGREAAEQEEARQVVLRGPRRALLARRGPQGAALGDPLPRTDADVVRGGQRIGSLLPAPVPVRDRPLPGAGPPARREGTAGRAAAGPVPELALAHR